MNSIVYYLNEILRSLDIPEIKTSKNKTEDTMS